MGLDMGGDMSNMAPTPYSEMNMMPDMHMTFFWGSHVQILFTGWPGNRSAGMYIFALFLTMATAALAESLSFLSQQLSKPPTGGRRASTGVLLTAVHALKMGLGYLIMLAVMSFNGGVFIAAVVGHVLGFFVCRRGILGIKGAGELPSTK